MDAETKTETEEQAYCPECGHEPTRWTVIDGEKVALLCLDCAEYLAAVTGLS